VEFCFGLAKRKGFWEVPEEMKDDAGRPYGSYRNLKKMEKIALIMSELGEAVEGIRKPGPDEHCPSFTKEEIEIADALIRIFDYAGGFGLKLAEAFEAKMEFNAQRPHKHGKAF
jgi:NTP pyrophosphatase (non-canonical NTP hydrolase)